MECVYTCLAICITVSKAVKIAIDFALEEDGHCATSALKIKLDCEPYICIQELSMAILVLLLFESDSSM